MKSDKKPEGVEPEFALMSQGIGKNFLTDAVKKYYKENQIPYVIWKDGQKMTMPRYFKEKIFTDEELKKFGEEALQEITPQTLDSSKIQEIQVSNKSLKDRRNERRNKI